MTDEKESLVWAIILAALIIGAAILLGPYIGMNTGSEQQVEPDLDTWMENNFCERFPEHQDC